MRFVNVSWDNYSKRFDVSKAAWDTHERNFPMLRETLLPNFDQTYSAFIDDLDARGLLDETLVVTMGEMGRTPKINAKGGRDHWTYCYSVLLAGAGIKGGIDPRRSDAHAAFIKDKPGPHPRHLRDDLPPPGHRPRDACLRSWRPADRDRPRWPPDHGNPSVKHSHSASRE